MYLFAPLGPKSLSFTGFLSLIMLSPILLSSFKVVSVCLPDVLPPQAENTAYFLF